MKRYFAAATIIAGMCGVGSAQAQSGLLDRLLKAVQAPSPGGGIKAYGRPTASVLPTSAQTASIRRQLAVVAAIPAVRRDLDEASPLVEATVVAVACATDGTALRSLNSRRLAPHNYPTPDDSLNFTAMGGMRYHDKTTCVDLSRIAAVTKPALNALQFKLNFVSGSSGEAKVQTVTFRKVGDEWLLDRLADFEVN